jgi:hypothetical protein
MRITETPIKLPLRPWRCTKLPTHHSSDRRVWPVECAASTSSEEAPFQALPVVYCSQYRTEKDERQTRPLPGNERVGEWLSIVETVYLSDGPAAESPLNPALPAAQRKDQYKSDPELEGCMRRRRRRRSLPAILLKDRQLVVHKNYELLFFRHQNSSFRHSRFATVFSSMKMAESRKIELRSRIVDFDEIQV